MHQYMKVKVEVTKEDLEKGIKESNTCCPVALALRRELAPNTSGISVGGYKVDFNPGGPHIYGHLDVPSNLREFIANFDNGYKDELATLPESERSFELTGWIV